MATEDNLRQHIHRLLFTYAKTHLTIDHITYSLELYNLIKPYFIKQVPLADPSSFTLPVDPFDALCKLYSIDQLSRYEERFKVNHGATQLLKQHLRTRPGILKTERVVLDDTHSLLSLEEPLQPLLTRRSLRAGPFLGKSVHFRSVPSSSGALVRCAGIRSVDVEAMPEPEVPYERTLKISWVLNAEQREDIRNLLKHVTDMRRPQPNYRNVTLHAFLHEDTMPVLYFPEEQQFTPIFPRSRRFGHGNRQINAGIHEQDVKALQEMLPEAKIGSDDADINLAQANLEVVNGWHTLRVSSPVSPATPTTSQEDDRIDQLFLEDSPPTEPMIGLMNEKIGEIEIPRSRRIGGTYGRSAHVLHGKTISSFLPSLLRVKTPNSSTRTKPKSPSLSPQSILGQASIDVETVYDSDEENDWKKFTADIERLYPKEDPTDIIMKTKVEEKNDMFMEVPQLSPPNVPGPVSLDIPTKLSDLTQDIGKSCGRRVLKKALKGLPTLRLSLSWVTFTVDTPLPSHQEVSGVSDFFSDSITRKDVDELLRCSLLEGSPAAEARLAVLNEDVNLPGMVEQDSGPLIMISRKDRQAGLENTSLGHTSPITKRSASDTSRQIPPVNDGSRSPKRPRVEAQDELHEFRYEPSVLQFEDIIDTRMFYETPTSDPLRFSSIEGVLLGQESAHHNAPATNDSFTHETNATTLFGLDITSSTLVNSGLVDPSAALALDHELSRDDMDLHTSRLTEFTQLRAKIISDPPVTGLSVDLPPSSSPTNLSSSLTDEITTTIMDKSTFFVPENVSGAKHPHRYMASLEFVQRQAIVRALRTPECNVDLAERTCLGGVDLIVDPHSAIIVASLFTLPAHGKQLLDRISEHSWRFQSILVLLEAYPQSLALKPPKSNLDVPNISAYTPPILKAIKKLRRDVVISEVCGKKRAECRVDYGFANDVGEAAKFVRCFGDFAEERDESGGLLWQPREWLDLETFPDEEDLLKLKGMNRMSAVVLLCNSTAEEILNMLPEERVQSFGALIGINATKLLNEDLNERLWGMEVSEQESDFLSGSS